MGWLGWSWPLAVQPGSWVVLCLVAAVAAAASTLAERQRRTTLLALVRDAPVGTVIVQAEGRGGPAMRVQVGDLAQVRRDEESG